MKHSWMLIHAIIYGLSACINAGCVVYHVFVRSPVVFVWLGGVVCGLSLLAAICYALSYHYATKREHNA